MVFGIGAFKNNLLGTTIVELKGNLTNTEVTGFVFIQDFNETSTSVVREPPG